MSVGQSEVPINPSEDHPPSQAPTVSITTDKFKRSNAQYVKSYKLLLRVTYSSASGATVPTDSDTGGRSSIIMILLIKTLHNSINYQYHETKILFYSNCITRCTAKQQLILFYFY